MSGGWCEQRNWWRASVWWRRGRECLHHHPPPAEMRHRCAGVYMAHITILAPWPDNQPPNGLSKGEVCIHYACRDR